MRDVLYLEIFDCQEPTPVTAQPVTSPLDRETFPFEPSDHSAARLARQLAAEELAEQLIGMPLEKLRTETAIRSPIDVNTFEQAPLPTPSELDENPVALCTCSCPECRSRKCEKCSAASKCKFYRSSDAEKAHRLAVTRLCERARGRIAHEGTDEYSKAALDYAWRDVEESMARFVTREVTAVS